MAIPKINTTHLLPVVLTIGFLVIGIMHFGLNLYEQKYDKLIAKPVDLKKSDLVVVAVGDIACSPEDPNFNGGQGVGDHCRHKSVADAIKKEEHIDVLILLGDIQYQYGDLSNFQTSLAPFWKDIKADVVLSVPGNHDWGQGNINGYQIALPLIFPKLYIPDSKATYFMWQKNNWRIFGLDSDCNYTGGCGAGDPQNTWLGKQLSKAATGCTLAFWHHPVFNSGEHRVDGTNQYMHEAWRTLDQHGVSVALTGHEHTYERFYKQSLVDGDGPGIREFIVGTGGRNLYNFISPYDKGHEVGYREFGYLKMILRRDSYAWQFINTNGAVRDTGRDICN